MKTKTYAVRIIGSKFSPYLNAWIEGQVLHIEEGFANLGAAKAWTNKRAWQFATSEGTKIETVKIEVGY